MMEVRIEERGPQPLLSIRRKVLHDQLGQAMAHIFPTVGAYVKSKGIGAIHPPVSIYRSIDHQGVDLEGGLRLEAEALGEGEIKASALPGGKIATTIHIGPYDQLTKTHQALQDWLKEHGHKEAGVAWEFYLTDPDQEPDASKWQTEICWLLE